MKNLKSHFAFNRSERNGILILVLVIISLQLLYVFYPFSSEKEQTPEEQRLEKELQHSIDSLKQVAAEKNSVKMQPFNPNFISDYKGYLLGMSEEQIDRLHEYRSKGLWINSSEDFREITGVSDTLLKKIEPYFKFPEFQKRNLQNNTSQKGHFSAPLEKQDLNAASAEELRLVNGIGEKLSTRIVKYRESIGGFRGIIQLQDVYGLQPEVVERLLKRFEVKEQPSEKANLNTITALELSEMPYFDYELARAIIDFRRREGKIESFESLDGIKNFPKEKINRIKLYLKLN
ncbi:MAG: helix-hairpin-helix domain-containing protein [Salinimicrobium sp.]